MTRELRTDVNVHMDATGVHCEVSLVMYIKGMMQVSQAREMAKLILEKCDDADKCLSQMYEREKQGFKGVKRYPERKVGT